MAARRQLSKKELVATALDGFLSGRYTIYKEPLLASHHVLQRLQDTETLIKQHFGDEARLSATGLRIAYSDLRKDVGDNFERIMALLSFACANDKTRASTYTTPTGKKITLTYGSIARSFLQEHIDPKLVENAMLKSAEYAAEGCEDEWLPE